MKLSFLNNPWFFAIATGLIVAGLIGVSTSLLKLFRRKPYLNIGFADYSSSQSKIEDKLKYSVSKQVTIFNQSSEPLSVFAIPSKPAWVILDKFSPPGLLAPKNQFEIIIKVVETIQYPREQRLKREHPELPENKSIFEIELTFKTKDKLKKQIIKINMKTGS